MSTKMQNQHALGKKILDGIKDSIFKGTGGHQDPLCTVEMILTILTLSCSAVP